jgi:cold shock protein
MKEPKVADRQNGTVKWFNNSKGYGFIAPADGSKDLFVHYSAITDAGEGYRSLNEGDQVEFNVEQGQKGLQATNVVRTN